MTDRNNFSAYEGEIRRVLGSKEGLALLKLLNQDGGATLRQAAAAFQNGDQEAAKALLTPVMETEEAQALVQALNQNG